MKTSMLSVAVATALVPLLAMAGPQAVPGDPTEALHGAAESLRESLQGLSRDQPSTWRDGAVEQAREALRATNNAIVTLASEERDRAAKEKEQPEADSKRGGGQSTEREAPAGPPAGPGEGNYAILVVPAQDTLDRNVANGCWARVYSEPDFQGRALTLMGNVEVPDIGMSVAGECNGPSSLVVGPGATLVARGSGEGGEKTIRLNADDRLSDLDATRPRDLFAGISAVKLACL